MLNLKRNYKAMDCKQDHQKIGRKNRIQNLNQFKFEEKNWKKIRKAIYIGRAGL